MPHKNISSIRLYLLSILYLLWALTAAQASSYKQLTIEEAVQNSELIFEGVVDNIYAAVPNDRQSVYTFVNFRIMDVLKGGYSGASIELRYPGGELDGRVEYVADMIIPKPGEHGIYFVKSLTEHFVHPLTGWTQGQLIIVKNAQGNEQVFSAQGVPIQAITPQVNAKTLTNPAPATPELALGVVAAKSAATAISAELAKKQLLQLIKP